MARPPARGFTLIELMIVLAIIGIIASFAIPNYMEYRVKANRKAAQATLLEIASRQRAYFLDARAFAASAATLGVAVPSDVSSNYTIAITPGGGTPPSYVVRATPIAGGNQVADGELTLDNLGNRNPAEKW